MEEEIVEWLDSSKIDLLNLCPRKYYYRYELHLLTKSETLQDQVNNFSAMMYGAALHQSLASLYNGSAFDLVYCPCPDFEGCNFCKGNLIPRMAAVFLIYYPQDPESDKDPRTQAHGIEILYAYLEKWKRETFQEVVGVEIPFSVPFYSDRCLCGRNRSEHNLATCDCSRFDPVVLFTYVGRIDLLVREDDKLKPYDHKSCSRYGQQFEQQFKLSGQATGYMRSTHTIIGGEPITELGINAIRVTTNISDESFLRLTTKRTQEEFDDWDVAVRDAFDRIQRHRQTGYWYKHAPYACSAYNRTCEYYSLCTAGEQVRQELIANNFDKIPWNPIED